jgi:hypothetical protein
VDGFFLEAGDFPHFEKYFERLLHQGLFDAGIMHLDDLAHGVAIGKADEVKEAAAQERIRQFFFVVAGNDDDRALARANRFAGFVDKKFHAIQFEQQVVREFDVCFIDFVDQQHTLLVAVERIPELALFDVVANVLHFFVAELRIAQARHRIVFVQALLSLGGGFDMPGQQRLAERQGNFFGQQRFAGAGFALDQQRPLQRDGRIDGQA